MPHQACGGKMEDAGMAQAQTPAYSMQLQGASHQKHRRGAGRTGTQRVCLKAGDIWICCATRRMKGRRQPGHRPLKGEWNLISSPANPVLFHSASRLSEKDQYVSVCAN